MRDQQLLQRSFVTVILLFAFVLFPVRLARAGVNRWTANGPEGGDIRSFAIDPGNPQVIYIVTYDRYNQVFKSADGGSTWTPIAFGVSEFSLTAFLVDPHTPMALYASGDQLGLESGIGFSGVLKSTDGGNTWQASNEGLTNTDVRTLAIDSTLPSTLYAATSTGVFRSTNGGARWAPLSPSFFDLLVIDPKTPTTLYATLSYSGDGLLKSIDGGVTWEPINAGLPPDPGIFFITLDPVTPTTLYTSPYGGGISSALYKSIDGGATWASLNTDLPSGPLGAVVTALAIDPLVPTTLYAATEKGVFKSTTGGTDWTQSNAGVPDRTSIHALAVDPQTSSTVYAGTGGNGVFKSTDAAHTWNARNTGLFAAQITALASDPTNPQLLYIGTTGGVFKSTDGGTHWELTNQGLPAPATSFAIDPRTPTILYAATERGVFKSVDSGQTWTAKNNGITNRATSIITLNPLTPTTLYVGTTSTFDTDGHFFNGGIFTSTDGGEIWSPANTGLPANPGDRISISTLAIDPKTPTIPYAAVNVYNPSSFRPSSLSNIFKSTDGGLTWEASENALLFGPFVSISSLAIDPQTPTTVYAGVLFYVGPGGVMKSTNGGETWTLYNNGFMTLTPHLSAIVIDPLLPTTLYAGTSSQGVFKSTDSGVNWVPLNVGLTSSAITALTINPVTGKTLYAGTRGGGVFEFQVGSGSADLSITQNDSPDLVHTGDNLTYTLTITNHGPSEATGVTITDTLPPGVTVVSVTPSQGTCTGQSTIMCELEAVASGATATVTLVVQVLPSAGTGGMSNTVSVGNIEPDPDPANNTATVVTTVVTPEGPDLVGSWVKTSGRCREAGTSTVNCKFKGTILVKNQGTRDATNSALRVHRSADSTLDSNDSLLREFGIGNLKVGKGQKRKLKIKFSISPEPPGAYLIAILDVNNAVVEMIEANNQAIVHVALGGVFTVP